MIGASTIHHCSPFGGAVVVGVAVVAIDAATEIAFGVSVEAVVGASSQLSSPAASWSATDFDPLGKQQQKKCK